MLLTNIHRFVLREHHQCDLCADDLMQAYFFHIKVQDLNPNEHRTQSGQRRKGHKARPRPLFNVACLELPLIERHRVVRGHRVYGACPQRNIFALLSLVCAGY